MPYLFDEFFSSGKSESISPFLTPSSRKWGKHLPLRASLLSAFFWILSLVFSFSHPDLSALFLVFVYFLSGTPAIINTISDIRDAEVNIDVLMTLAALLSILINSALEGGLLLVLFEFSAAMETMVMNKTKNSLFALHKLSPKTATVVKADGSLYEKSIHEVPLKSSILIKAGEIVPLDGIVISGSSSLNLAHLTGEATPIFKKNGDEVPAGAKNLEGALTLEVTKSSADSTLSHIIKLITEAQESKPRLETFLDRFGKKYALTIIALFILFALFLPVISSIPYLGVEGSIYRALTFLITASPCALIIATPTAYLSAMSACAKKGILLKGGHLLDSLAACSNVAFDKTGTLTTGELQLVSLEQLLPGISEEKALQVAASLEKHAVHPIAKAILEHAKNLPFVPLNNFHSEPGFGLSGTWTKGSLEIPCAIGHRDFLDKHIPKGISNEWMLAKRKMSDTSLSSTYLLIGESVFVFFFKDTVRPQAQAAISCLLEKNKKVVLVTGDRKTSADLISHEIGIGFVYSDLRPEDKLNIISTLSQEGGVAMLGDGVNDAPALARATVGISMGQIGSGAAIDASDVVFLQDDLSLLSWLFAKSESTLRIVRQNLFLALSVIVLATTPALLGLIPLWLAVVLHEGGTVLVGLNSLRLLKK